MPAMRGDRPRVIVEEFIKFDSEITLLTVATPGGVIFCPPVGHRQEAGDYRESWQPAEIPREALQSARFQARKIVDALGGHGIFGVEFFVCGDQAIFSELSPRPHDTGMLSACDPNAKETKATVVYIDRTCTIITTKYDENYKPTDHETRTDSCNSIAEWDKVREKRNKVVDGTAVVHVSYMPGLCVSSVQCSPPSLLLNRPLPGPPELIAQGLRQASHRAA